MYRAFHRLFLLLGTCLPALSASAQFTDDFSDGDFTAAPAWSGSTTLFTVDAGQLRSNSPGAATYYLGTPSALATSAQWEFFANLAFGTSGSNYVDVYLTSDAADLTTGVSGYFVRIGDTDDNVVLYRADAGTGAQLVAGTPGIVNSSSNNPFRIKITRDAGNNWSLLLDDGATGTYTLAGTATDATYTTSSHFGIRVVQSSAAGPVNKHFFDDFAVSALVADVDPPTIVSATATSATTVDVFFNEAVEEISAGTIGNYALLPAVGIATAGRDVTDLALVHLTLSSALTNGTDYTLTATNVADLAGNATPGTNTTFSFVVPETAVPGDVVINEIMADPTPVVGLPEAEFIELYNTTDDKTFDLTGWTISDGGTPATLPAYVLGPHAYVIIASTAAAPLFTSVPNKLAVPGFPSLNNDGDPLVLVLGAETIDAVTYELAWYQDAVKDDGGWTLERINPTTPCSNAANWIASADPSGGTPGAQNSVFSTVPDTQAPLLVSASVNTPTEVALTFSEPMNVTSLLAGTYTITPFMGITNVAAPDAQHAVLTLATALTEGQFATVTVAGVTDCPGNPIGAQNTASFGLPEPAQAGDVVINEIMADPTPVVGLPEAEFIELYNATDDKTFDLAGWTISDGGTPATLPSYVLPPHGYVIVTSILAAPLFPGANTVGAVGFPSLNNDGDPLVLNAPDNSAIDAVTFALSWYRDAIKDDGGWTLERIDPTTSCSFSTNWIASSDPSGGTPGAQNSVYSTVPDTQAPTLVSASVNSPTQVTLTFSEPMDLASLLAGTYTITPSIGITNVAAPDVDHVVLTLATALAEGQFATVTVTGVTDCPGNPIGAQNTAPFALPQAVEPGDVVINEVLYDPVGSGSDFVELYNRSQKVLGIAGWQLANVADGALNDAVTMTSVPMLLMPGAYLLVSEDGANIATTYPLSHTDRFLTADLPSFNNGEGSVVLLAADGDTLDWFDYNDDMHFELLNSTEGVGLERIDPARPTNDRSNWHSAAADIGFATPGYVNSQYAPAANANGEISIEPAIFSPDNDGHQDVLTIGYRFNDAGFVGNMKVFDIAGREVRTLMDNVLLSTTGAISWDGIMTTGELARMGPYVVYFEAFDLAGNVEKFRKSVVLAHRLD